MNRIYVGVSGGVDSMFLLHNLLQMGLKDCITCLNFNHGTPFGNESEALVREYCSLQGITFLSRLIDQDFSEGNKEGYWRNKRYEFFRKIVGTNTLLLAHHKTDQYVSWLMSCLKGSDRCFIPIIGYSKDTRIVRPLYLIEKSFIRSYIHNHSIPFMEDPTNTEGNRGRVEHELIPLVEDIIPHAKGVFKKEYMKYLIKYGCPTHQKGLNKRFLFGLMGVDIIRFG